RPRRSGARPGDGALRAGRGAGSGRRAGRCVLRAAGGDGRRHRSPSGPGEGRRPGPMTLTVAVLIACALAFVTKIVGYVIPPRLVEGERTMRVSTLLPAALLT